jgi:hypothetical protein
MGRSTLMGIFLGPSDTARTTSTPSPDRLDVTCSERAPSGSVYLHVSRIKGIFFYLLYSTLLYLPPLRFHCVYCLRLRHWQPDALTTRLDFIHIRLDLVHTRLDPIHTRLNLVHTRLDIIHTRLNLVHTRLDLIHTRLDLVHTRLDLENTRL